MPSYIRNYRSFIFITARPNASSMPVKSIFLTLKTLVKFWLHDPQQRNAKHTWSRTICDSRPCHRLPRNSTGLIVTLAAWCSDNGVWRIKFNEVVLRRARLVLRWVTVFDGKTISVFQQATQANSASYPQRDGKWVPAKNAVTLYGWGVKTGAIHSTCG